MVQWLPFLCSLIPSDTVFPLNPTVKFPLKFPLKNEETKKLGEHGGERRKMVGKICG